MNKNMYTLVQMTKRHLLIFLKDKAAVFFSLLAPLIVLVLYILFLGDVQVKSIEGALNTEGLTVDTDAIKAFLDSWMIAGVLAVACITVSFSANTVAVQDRQKNILNDSLASPVPRWVITGSYFVYNFIVTFFICLITFAVSLVYIAIVGHFLLTVGDIFATIGVIAISTLSATMITVFIANFFKTESQLSAIGGIMSAAIGFLIGAYMPMSMFPKAIQIAANLLPGSHSSGLFRNILMRGAFDNLAKGAPIEFVDALKETYSMKLNLFGTNVGTDIMMIVVIVSIILFAALNILFSFKRVKRQ